jgi:hypothetical protein
LAVFIVTPLLSRRLAGRDDAHDLLVAVITVRVSHNHQNDARYHADRLPALLAVDDTIENAAVKGIAENLAGGFETDMMLALVGAALLAIPDKAHSPTDPDMGLLV